MDYKLTFSDGSDGYLSHYGILGMHWGVRNRQTQLKYESGNGGQMFGRGSNATYGKLSGIRQRLHSKKVRDDVKTMLKDVAITAAAASMFLGSSKLYHMSKTPQGKAKILRGMNAVRNVRTKVVIRRAASSPKSRALAVKGAKIVTKLVLRR